MVTRLFNGSSDSITTAVGGLSGMDLGPYTAAAIVKKSADDATNDCVVAYADNLNNHRGTWLFDDPANAPAAFDGTSNSTAPFTFATADGWCLIAATKAAGTTTARFHKYRYSDTSWTHANGTGSITDAMTVPSDGQIGLGRNAFGNYFPGNLAVVGVWASVLSDNQIEMLEGALASWANLSPTALWAFNQSSTSIALDDLVGAADQTAISGTTVSSDEPSPFDWSLTQGPLLPVRVGPGRVAPAGRWPAWAGADADANGPLVVPTWEPPLLSQYTGFF